MSSRKGICAEHENDTDEALLAYLKEFVIAHPDHCLFKADVPGGELIGKRFGGWKEALKAARIPEPKGKHETIGYTREQQKNSRDAWNHKRQEEN